MHIEHAEIEKIQELCKKIKSSLYLHLVLSQEVTLNLPLT